MRKGVDRDAPGETELVLRKSSHRFNFPLMPVPQRCHPHGTHTVLAMRVNKTTPKTIPLFGNKVLTVREKKSPLPPDATWVQRAASHLPLKIRQGRGADESGVNRRGSIPGSPTIASTSAATPAAHEFAVPSTSKVVATPAVSAGTSHSSVHSAKHPCLQALDIEAPWLDLEEIGEKCAIDWTSIEKLKSELADFRKQTDRRAEAKKAPDADELPEPLAHAKRECIKLHDEALAVVEAHVEFNVHDTWFDTDILGRVCITTPSAHRFMGKVLDEIQEELEEADDDLKNDHGGEIPAALAQAQQRCLRLHQRARQTLEAQQYLGFQAHWLKPPALDLRCLNRSDIETLRKDLNSMLAQAQKKMDKSSAATGPDPALLRQAFELCRTVHDEALALAEEHYQYYSAAPELERKSGGATEPKNKGLLGFEFEGGAYFEKLFRKGEPMAKVPHGMVEGELQADLPKIWSVPEIVALPLKNPRKVDQYARGAMNYYCGMSRFSDIDAPMSLMSSFWPPSQIITDAAVKSSYSTTIGTSAHSQTTPGIFFIEHMPLVIEKIGSNSLKKKQEEDIKEIKAQFKRIYGRNLSRKSEGFLSFIATLIRECNQNNPDVKTAHRYISVMPRKSLSSTYTNSLKSKLNRMDVKKLLDPDKNNGHPLLMEILGIPKDKMLFSHGHMTVEMEVQGGEITAIDTDDHEGPSVKDFLESIIDPQKFGRMTDLISPLEGEEHGEGRPFGIASLGEADAGTGELIVEIRADHDLPTIVPVTALPTLGMLNFMKWSPFNPNIPQVYVDRSLYEQAEANEKFREIAKLYEDLIRVFKDLRAQNRPPPNLILGTFNAIQANVIFISDHSGIDGMKSALTDLLYHLSQHEEILRSDNAKECVESVARNLFVCFPNLLSALYAPEQEAWEQWLQDNPPTPGAADEDFSDMLAPQVPPSMEFPSRPPTTARRIPPIAPIFLAQAPLSKAALAQNVKNMFGSNAEASSVTQAVAIIYRLPSKEQTGFLDFMESIAPKPLNLKSSLPLMEKASWIPATSRSFFSSKPDLIALMEKSDLADFKKQMRLSTQLISAFNHPRLSLMEKDWLAAPLVNFLWKGEAEISTLHPLVNKLARLPQNQKIPVAKLLNMLHHPDHSLPDMIAISDWIVGLAPDVRDGLVPWQEENPPKNVERVGVMATYAALGESKFLGSPTAWPRLAEKARSGPAAEPPWDTFPRQLLNSGPAVAAGAGQAG